MRRALPLLSLLLASSAAAVVLADARPAAAIETGAPQELPPPPPPPLTTATPGTGAAPRPAPKKAPAATPPPAASPATPSSSSRDVGVTSYQPSAESPPGEVQTLDTRWALAPLLGFASDNLSAGIGLRGGKTLDNPHVYLGGTFVFHFINTFGAASASAFYLGPEAGYDFAIKSIVVRPYMGLGIFNASVSVGGVGGSGSEFVVWPGCSVIYDVPDSQFFVGGDMRVITVPGGAVGLYALGGMHFGT